MDSTPGSLLEHLRTSDENDAADRFVRLFTPLIYNVARRCGMQADDALDVVQEVFVLLSRKINDFQYDPALSIQTRIFMY